MYTYEKYDILCILFIQINRKKLKSYTDFHKKDCVPASSISYSKNLTEFFYSTMNSQMGISRTCIKKVCSCDYLGFDLNNGKNLKQISVKT